ncbi:MAG: hypothetical protein ACOYD3_02320 [Kiritimatiellia bacterium]
MVAGMGRQPPAVPAGTAVPAVPGIEDEDEDENPPISSSFTFDKA